MQAQIKKDIENSTNDRVFCVRADVSDVPKMVKTDEGYLKGDAIVTRLGVFTYQNDDGSLRKELRHPDDILSQDSLNTLKMLPITVNHPADLVNSKNVGELSVGSTGDSYKIDGRHIISPLVIHRDDGVDAVDAGKRQLSLGYTTDLLSEVGEYNGEKYTHRQTNVKYNHLSLVDVARAGSNARINTDGFAYQTDGINENGAIVNDNDKEVEETTDAVAPAATPPNDEPLANPGSGELAEMVVALRSELDVLKAQVQDLLDEETGDEPSDEVVGEGVVDEKTNTDSININELVKVRVALIAGASKVVKDSDSLMSMTDREIMQAVIATKHDALDLSSKSDDYVQARFDSILETLPTCDAVARQVAQTTTVNADSSNLNKKPFDIVKNQWKKEA